MNPLNAYMAGYMQKEAARGEWLAKLLARASELYKRGYISVGEDAAGIMNDMRNIDPSRLALRLIG